ncbi:MAG: glycosyltransferase [Prevotella sp.]|nr:glycosyltransferase [Prevotella sp.]
MKVSIIIPIYNVADYVSSCIKSVMEQTYQDIECILVDDCGNDDSMEICNKLISSYQGNINFITLHHEKNRGLSAARNTGTKAATGDYIFYLDSDDLLFPKCIELMIDAVVKHPGVELVQGITESHPFHKSYCLSTLKNIDYTEEAYWMRLHFFSMPIDFYVNAWNKLLKKEFLIKNDLFFKEGLIHEDQLWMYFVALCVSKIVIIHEYTYIHLNRENSIMATDSMARTAKHWGIILTEILNNLQEPYANRALLRYLLRFLLYYKISISDEVYDELYNKFRYLLHKHNYRLLNIFLFLFKRSPFLLVRLSFRKIIYYLVKFHLNNK